MTTTIEGPYPDPFFAPPDPEPWEAPDPTTAREHGAGTPFAPERPDPVDPRITAAISDSQKGPVSSEAAEAVGAPEAVEHAKTAALRDRIRQWVAENGAHGVSWSRPSELISQAGAALSGRGINLTEHLSRRTRSATATGVRKTLSTTRNLPPLSAFGRGRQGPEAPSRAAAGMS